MIFEVKVEYHEEWDEKIESSSIFVCADSVIKAVQQVSNYYGENILESIDVRPFSPDNFLIFTEEDEELFRIVKHHLEENVVW